LARVALEGDTGPMIAPAIDLDDETARREEEVDLVRAKVGVGDLHVAVRPGQAGAAAEGAEAPLQLAAGEGRILGGGRAQRGCTPAPLV
jgi:hypothetical protein